MKRAFGISALLSAAFEAYEWLTTNGLGTFGLDLFLGTFFILWFIDVIRDSGDAAFKKLDKQQGRKLRARIHGMVPFSGGEADLREITDTIFERLRLEFPEFPAPAIKQIEPLSVQSVGTFRVIASENAHCQIQVRVMDVPSFGKRLYFRIERGSRQWTGFKVISTCILTFLYAAYRFSSLLFGQEADFTVTFPVFGLLILLPMWLIFYFNAKRDLNKYFPPERLSRLLEQMVISTGRSPSIEAVAYK
jgi:hypothetical protein